jgi:hypothetical protein
MTIAQKTGSKMLVALPLLGDIFTDVEKAFQCVISETVLLQNFYPSPFERNERK